MHYSRYPLVRSENDRVWRKYCGFLDLTVPQFMSIQEALLVQHLKQIAGSPLGRSIHRGKSIRSADEFRRLVPLSSCVDPCLGLGPQDEESLPEKPYVWASTSGGSGKTKWVPYTRQAYSKALENIMSIFILACSRQRGQSLLAEGDRILFNVAPKPYLSGILAAGVGETFNLRLIMPPEEHDSLDFREKVTKGFEVALRTGVDILIAMTSVLVKTGHDFNKLSSKKGGRRPVLLHPAGLCRVGRAVLRSKLERRSILPKDLWPVKALIGWGTDTSVYRNEVHRNWGAYPYEFHASTEGGIMAVQSWTRRHLTLIPQSNYFEFMPETEWLKSKNDILYEPRTVLLSEVKPGERYELVITSFYGMPFVRYRLGHLMRVTARADEEAGINLPQISFDGRGDDLIDIAGFTRISEKAVAQALANTGLSYEDWTVRKEIKQGKPILHLYIELDQDHQQVDLSSILHSELMNVDACYHDLAVMMDVQSPEVTVLRRGAFNGYYSERRDNGSPLAQRRPPRINASDEAIAALLASGSREVAQVGQQ